MGIFDWLDKIEIDKKFLASMGASETRTFLEDYYDKMNDTVLMERIRELPPSTQFIIRWGLYALGATADKKLDEKSAWHKFIKDVVVDIPSETAKRIRNKNTTGKETEKITESQEFLNLLLELEKSEILEIIGWLSELSEEEKIFMVKRLASISKSKFKKILKLDRKERNLMLTVIDTKKKSKGIKKTIEKELRVLAKNIQGKNKNLKGGKND